jgi:hypothetical protein
MSNSHNIENSRSLHFGAIVKKYIDKNKIAKASLARKLNISGSAIIAYQKSASLNTGALLEMTHALKHNFFQDIASMLPKTYSTDAPVDQTKEQRIAELELENMILKAEKAVLLLRG